MHWKNADSKPMQKAASMITMIRSLITLLLLSTHIAHSAASETEFSLKGITLGSEEKVCGTANITKQQETLNAIGVTGFSFPATGCNLTFDTVAGIAPSSPAHLLFWKGRLIRMIVNFESLNLSDAAALRTAFLNLHGKPTVKKSFPFRTDTWRHGATTLQLEWSEGTLIRSAGAYLTDTKNWADYENSRAKATKLVEDLDKKRRSDDLR